MTSYLPDILSLLDDGLRFLDQTLLPGTYQIVHTRDYRDVLEAIRSLRLRGAPLIGIAAASGIALAAREYRGDASEMRETLHRVCDAFAATRPTAVNLFWAVSIIRERIDTCAIEQLPEELRRTAEALHADDARRCAAIGMHGAGMFAHGARILTHCNSGALATGGEGTAFACLLEAHRRGLDIHVYADETRPLLQGARLTMWELGQHGIPCTLITDSTAAMLMRAGSIDAVITGADRIAANGDTANKIGTYGLAVAARAHGIPFYIAAPRSTIDLSISRGEDIPIEQRPADEVRMLAGVRVAPEDCGVYAPAFDVTPAELIAAIVTEDGVLLPPFTETLRIEPS